MSGIPHNGVELNPAVRDNLSRKNKNIHGIMETIKLKVCKLAKYFKHSYHKKNISQKKRIENP